MPRATKAVVAVLVAVAICAALTLMIMGSIWPGVVLGIMAGSVGALVIWGNR
jgi:hypothetical protein